MPRSTRSKPARSTRSSPRDVFVDKEYEDRISQIKLGKGAGAVLGQAFSSYLAQDTNDRGVSVSIKKTSPGHSKTMKKSAQK